MATQTRAKVTVVELEPVTQVFRDGTICYAVVKAEPCFGWQILRIDGHRHCGYEIKRSDAVRLAVLLAKGRLITID